MIDPSWVLTAAHCVVFQSEPVSPDELQIVANSHDLNNIASDPVDVVRIIIHETYNDLSNEGDIALLQLSSPAVTNAQVATLNTTPVPINERVLAAGWGARQFDLELGSFDFADNLHAVEVSALPAEQCNTLPAYAGAVSDTMLCAGVPLGGFDSCQGDSGGPLYRQNADGSLTVAGVTSWGDGCALEGRPGVYTDVASFNDWIRTNMSVTIDPPVMVATEDDAPDDLSPVDDETPLGGLSVSTDPEDGSTVIVVPSLASLQSSGGSAGAGLLLTLLGFIGVRASRALR